MNRFLIIAAVGVASVLALAQLGQTQTTGSVNPDTAALVKGNNTFAFDLYRRLAKDEGNLFFSPYSISSALAMTYGGAASQTAPEMKATLKFPFEDQQLHAAFANLVQEISKSNQQRKYQLSIANKLWGQKGMAYMPDFLKLTRESYGAGLQEVDFADGDKARSAINDWVAKETQSKIKDLLADGSLSNDTRLVLVNAIYFKAQWANSFSPTATKKDDFKLNASEKIKVDTMHQSEMLSAIETDTFQMLELPYEQNELSMLIILPRKLDGLGDLEMQLTGENVATWVAGMKKHRVNLSMPKFMFSSEFKLKDQLSRMGMSLAFSDGADFSKISSQGKLCLGDVIHKAFVAVDEKGTEAAAATAVTVMPTSAPVGKEMTVRVDHPFVFLVRDNRTGATMFVGRVAHP